MTAVTTWPLSRYRIVKILWLPRLQLVTGQPTPTAYPRVKKRRCSNYHRSGPSRPSPTCFAPMSRTPCNLTVSLPSHPVAQSPQSRTKGQGPTVTSLSRGRTAHQAPHLTSRSTKWAKWASLTTKTCRRSWSRRETWSRMSFHASKQSRTWMPVLWPFVVKWATSSFYSLQIN